MAVPTLTPPASPSPPPVPVPVPATGAATAVVAVPVVGGAALAQRVCPHPQAA